MDLAPRHVLLPIALVIAVVCVVRAFRSNRSP